MRAALMQQAADQRGYHEALVGELRKQLALKDAEKAEKLKRSLPPNVKVEEIGAKKLKK